MRYDVEAGRQAAQLLGALNQPDPLTCAQAQAQIPDFVEAEHAEQDVDTDPAYATLLLHLDHCADCTALYEELTDDLEALVGEAETLPRVRPAAPAFFAPARENENLVLRVLQGLTRRFEMTFALPRLTPVIATLSAGQQANLFSDRLVEVKGDPFMGVTLRVNDDQAAVMVAIREASTDAHWHVRLTSGDIERNETTDEQGIARFGDLPVASLQALTLFCAELAPEA